MTMKKLTNVKIGDTVTRWLGGTVPMTLRVTGISHAAIECGPYTFNRATGAEMDEDLDWGPPPKTTGSYIAMGER